MPNHPDFRSRRPSLSVLPVARLRAELVIPGDVRSEIAFQNDVNALVAALDELPRTAELAAPPFMSAVQRRPSRRAATTARLKAFRPPRGSGRVVAA